MKDVDFKIEYEYFLETLNLSYDLGIELCRNIKNSINPSDKNHNLEWKLFYLEEYLKQLEKIIEMTEKSIFFDPPLPKTVQNTNNLLILPLYPDEDIFVPADGSIAGMFKKKQ